MRDGLEGHANKEHYSLQKKLSSIRRFRIRHSSYFGQVSARNWNASPVMSSYFQRSRGTSSRPPRLTASFSNSCTMSGLSGVGMRMETNGSIRMIPYYAGS